MVLSKQIKFIGIWLSVFIVVEVINFLTGRGLNGLGIYPREIIGLRGIVFSPFLHGSIGHFLSNIVTLGIFSALMLQYSKRTFISSTVFMIVCTGLIVWILGRSAMHIGASGLVYGYFGFLLLGGWLSKRFTLLAISLVVAFFYGGLIFGVLPGRTFVSWESHLFGFLIGLVAAKIWAKTGK